MFAKKEVEELHMADYCGENAGAGKCKLLPAVLNNLNEAMDNLWRNRSMFCLVNFEILIIRC